MGKGYIVGALAMAMLIAGCGGNGGGNGTTDVAGADDGVQLIPDTTIGADYGATGPRKCSTRKVPADGPPSNETIAKYVICGGEEVTGSNLYLYDNVVVTDVAPGRPYNPNEDINMSNIDINKPVYAIKGSLRGYQCGPVMKPGGYDGGPDDHKGTNCSRTTEPNASGLCYQDTFGDWYCNMLDVSAPVNAERQVAAP
ncbi:hypothetical protein [Sphingomonas sp.]|jgi:hypothetical protein|uniref:hypothetical protein n=1 Tax=Sphingomonas sp. TaxID=28214 RepID=UPI002E35BD43|nr:hypothetical protein [Sphingomonas sp.]HEX4694755.1 hypothetical protein [Sphingomonas sp.]